jgi:hypothetical protein
MANPQLVSQDFGGKLSADIDATRSRLTRGGSWKKQRVVVILPTADMLAAKVALSHWNMIFPPNNGVVRILALGQEVGEAYSNAIGEVLAHPELSQWEYILTIESDNMPPPEGVLQLMETMDARPEFACVGGLYFTKGDGGVAQIWGDASDPALNFRPQIPIPGAVQECCGTGMGFNLWRLSMFRDARLRRPWFKTVAGPEGVGTQDLYAWADFRKYGYRCAIDNRVRVGHYDVTNDIIY